MRMSADADQPARVMGCGRRAARRDRLRPERMANTNRQKIFPILLLVALIPVATTSCAPEEGARGNHLSIAVEFTSHSACAHIAHHLNWFEEEGLTVRKYESYVTGMAIAAALARGDIDAAYICLIPAINARANAGVPIRIICGVHEYGYGLVVDPEKVESVRDLDNPGIRIGCTREGSPCDALLDRMVDSYGLERKNILGNLCRMNSPRQLLGLRAGRLDAAFVCEQYPSMAVESGFQILLTARDLWPHMQGSVLAVREELVEERPHVVGKLVKVTRRAVDFINDRPDEAAAIVCDELRIAGGEIFPSDATDIASELAITPSVMKRSLLHGLVTTADLDPEEIQKTIDNSAKLGYIAESFPAADFVDLRMIR